MDDDKFKDLLEDEELTALRLAALASKKKNDQNLNKSESATALPIDSIVSAPCSSSESASNQIPFVQSDRSGHNNYSWRHQNQFVRRRGTFPEKTHRVKRRDVVKIDVRSVICSRYKKINHFNKIQDTSQKRSNLIVISPVTLKEDKGLEDKAPPLILPQHKWCNSGNEDSMSPKTLRRTGPTRFNRHGSDSESSEDESDYDHSDNDSGSNETILQDEPPEHFSHLSPGRDNLCDEQSRRLSFQSLDSDVKSDTFDKNAATSVYKSLKSSLYSDTNPERYSIKQHINDELTFISDEKKYSNCNVGPSYTTRSSDAPEDQVFNQGNSSMGKAENFSNQACASLNALTDTSNIWQDTNVSNTKEYYSKDSQSFRMDDRNYRDYVDKRQSSQTITDTHDSRKSFWQHNEGFRTDNSSYPRENQCNSADSKIYGDGRDKSSYLSDNDLRMELKKRMQEMKSKTSSSENNEIFENRLYSQYNNSWDGNGQRYSHKNDEEHLLSVNSYSENQATVFHQANRINQNFNRENDADCSSNFKDQRSYRSISRERTTQEKTKSEYSSDRRRYDRSSSLDRNRNVRSSSRSRRRERSFSQDRMKNSDEKAESSLSPGRKKNEYSYRPNKNDDSRNVIEGKIDRYKSSPREKSHRSPGQDKNRRDCSSSSESKHEHSSSENRNKFSFSNSKNKDNYDKSVKDRHYTRNHEKYNYRNNVNRDRSKHRPNSTHNENRRERSLSCERSRRESSRSPDSRSEHSSSPEKNRYSSSRERSKDERSSSESESRYKCNSRRVSKFSSDQHRRGNFSSQETNVKEKEGTQKFNSLLKSEEIKAEESLKINTKNLSQSVERKRSERSNSKEKVINNKKLQQKYNSRTNSYKKRYSRSRSSSSESCSSSYSSSSSHSRPKIRSVTSVIKPVSFKSDMDNKGNPSENKPVGKSLISTVPQSSVHSVSIKLNLDNVDINKPSNIKCGRMDGDSKASEAKRVPVHMRLGAFPRKRVIQMPKDVEAAFVNSSSSSEDETVNTKFKRQNIRIVTDLYDAKNRLDLNQQKLSSDDKSGKRSSPDTYKENFKRVKAHR